MMTATILFDFDGVLVDSIEIFSDAVNIAGRKLEQPVAFIPDDLRSIKRMSIPEIVAAANVDPRLSAEFIWEIDQALYERFDQIRLFPSIAEVVEQLSQLGKLGVVSASSMSVLDKVLDNEGIRNHFDVIVGGDMPGTKSAKINAIIRNNGTSTDKCCMIGDTVSDIEQGKIAGVVTIAVSWGWYAIEWIRTVQPDFEAGQPEDLIDIIKNALLPAHRTFTSETCMTN